MKKLFIIFIFLYFSLCLFSSKSQAEAILWSELTIYLDTLTFTTTGDLNVTFPDGTPQGTLVSRDEEMYSDIEPGSWTCPECNYVAGDLLEWTIVQKTWNLDSTGSGDLTIEFDFYWEFDALPWAMPDDVAGGPDNVYPFVYVNDIWVGHYQSNVRPPQAYYGSIWPQTKHFEEGEIETLTIIAQTNANGAWIDKPIPPARPVPEPATIILFGSGLIGLAGWGRRKFKKSIN